MDQVHPLMLCGRQGYSATRPPLPPNRDTHVVVAIVIVPVVEVEAIRVKVSNIDTGAIGRNRRNPSASPTHEWLAGPTFI